MAKSNLLFKTRGLQFQKPNATHLTHCMDDVDDKERTPAEKKNSHDYADLVVSDHGYGDIVFEIMNSYTPRY